MEKTQLFSAEEAYSQAKRDYQIALEAADYIHSLGPITEEQKAEVVGLVLRMRYDGHIREGRLMQR